MKTLLAAVSTERDAGLAERDDLRKDRSKERQRERNIARAAPDKRCVPVEIQNLKMF